MFRVARELAQRKRRYPEPYRLGEEIARDRCEFFSVEDRQWHLTMVDSYLREVSEDAVRMALALAQRRGYVLDEGALSTIGIACGVAIDPLVRKYISSGAAAEFRKAMIEHRDDYNRGREIAEMTFFPEPDLWLATAPLVANGVMLREDQIGLSGAFLHNAFSPKFADPSVGQSGFYARMAELIRHYLSPENEEELRLREAKASARRAKYKEVSKEVEAEFRARGNYSGAEMIAETDRRMAERDVSDG